MASTYTPLGIELQATGENAGTWGTKTNTNLQIFEQISGGYTTQDSSMVVHKLQLLSVSDGSTGAVLSHRMIEFTGSITGNQIVTIPLDVQTFYFLRNSTSGSQLYNLNMLLDQEILLLFQHQTKVIKLFLQQQTMEQILI